jgi:glycerate kinase
LYNDGAKDFVAVTPLEKNDLEMVIAFEQFPESKTAINIAEWLKTSHTKAVLKPEYIMCHATDGASNAVGLSMECQAMTDVTKADSIWHYTCYTHQVNRAASMRRGLEILYRTTMLN